MNSKLYICLLFLSLASCKTGIQAPDVPCVDQDNDRYGEGCLLGPDCDDTDSTLNFSCDCGSTPMTGCACGQASEIDCFEADPRFIGVGICTRGHRYCTSSKWSACVGQTLPEPERCDDLDNDCDGTLNEGLQCNSCGNNCLEVTVGNGGFVIDTNSTGVKLDPNGQLVLTETGGQAVHHSFLYVANASEDTVSKINTDTGREEARYISALTSADARNRGHAPPSGNSPSRTTVALNGDVWVANRAPNQQGTVTKIAAAVSDCIDVNQNGRIDTSRDANGDGRINPADPAEFLGNGDECILFTVDIGAPGDIPRAMALDASESDSYRGGAWVGAYSAQKFYKLNETTGAVEAQVSVGINPYGAAIDSNGTLWATEPGTKRITSINVRTNQAGPVITLGAQCMGSYGIAVDLHGRVWLGGYGGRGACRYDPADGSTLAVPVPSNGLGGRGRGIAVDNRGYVWLALDGNPGQVSRFKADDGSDLLTFAFPSGNTTIGVGVDFNGKIWGVNQSGSTCRLDPDSGQTDCFPVGSGPYTYSDFTGFALRFITAPPGTFRQVLEGCANAKTVWKKLLWQADVPAGTAITVFVRAANTVDALKTAPRQGPFKVTPVDLTALGQIAGRYMQVEITLTSDSPGVTPAVGSFSAQYSCESDDPPPA